jgi:hypothetical protein
MEIFTKLFGKKNPIERMDVDELREMEIRLNHRIDSLNSEVKPLDLRISALFEQAKATKSKNEEINLARRIKTISQKKEMKLAALAQMEKELRAVSNLLILKEHERDLKTAGVWDRIKNINPEDLENWLIKEKITATDREGLISTVTEMTTQAMETGIEPEEDIEDILTVIRTMKSEEYLPDIDKISHSQEIELKRHRFE